MRKIIIAFLVTLSLLFSNINCAKAQGAEGQDTKLFKQDSPVAEVFKTADSEYYLTDKDLYLMAQIVYAESKGEPFEGKVAVASVILNRLNYPEFPKSVKAVVMQKNAFSCVENQSIDVIPDESSYRAVLEAIKGNDPTEEAVFFYNPEIATSKWMKNVSKKDIRKIGRHVFFKP